MPVILPDNALAAQLPQPRIVITTRGNQIRRVCAKRAIPHPPLMPMQRRLQRKAFILLSIRVREIQRVGRVAGRRELGGPDASRMVGGAGCEFPDVRGEKDTGYVGVMGDEFTDGDE